MAVPISDCIEIMSLAIGRRNELDPDSSNGALLLYISDFITHTMTDDVKLFENFSTLSFDIGVKTINDGVYTMGSLGLAIPSSNPYFSNVSSEGFITLKDPATTSWSWNKLYVFQDPGFFYQRWGINNYGILVAGFPTEMLYYGNEFVFRTIPDTDYTVNIYGYKINQEIFSASENLPQDYWKRYVAYGAALNYARDFRFDAETKSALAADFAHERKLLLTRTHNQIKNARCFPRF